MFLNVFDVYLLEWPSFLYHIPLHYVLSHYCYIGCLPSSDPQLLVKSIAAACLHGGTLCANKDAQRHFHTRSRTQSNQNAVSHLF